MARCIGIGGTDFGMPDAMKIAGVTGWLRAAETAGLPVSSHLFPQVSAHLLAASPTGHWLEYVGWAEPILAELLRIQDSAAIAADAPGAGIAWNEAMIARCLVS